MDERGSANKVLVAVDGSEASERALDHALTLRPDEITLITVIDPLNTDPLTPGLQTPSGAPGLPGYSSEWYDGVRDEIASFHGDLESQLSDADCPIASVITYGHPARQIVHYADEHECDHIVLGRHGQDAVSRILLGSVSSAVVKRSLRTVTAVA